MKAHHFGILFIGIALVLFLFLDIKTSQLKAVIDEENKMDQCLTNATDSSAQVIAKSYTTRQLVSSKEESVETFFSSMYASLGLIADPVAQQKIRMYIPVILVTGENGFNILYNDEYKIDGVKNVAMRWSEQYSYYYEDEYFVYGFTLSDIVKIYDKNGILGLKEAYQEIDFHEVATSDSFKQFRNNHPNHFLLSEEDYYLVRKGAIIKLLNEKMEYYVNNHNYIASQYGIAYQFSLPVIDESELIRTVENPGIIVIFQGYPLTNLNEIYNRCIVAGAQIFKSEIYYIEEKGWYKLYHSSACSECNTNPNIDTTIPYYSQKDCVKQGAYGAECCTSGVYVPDYHLH